jgi:protein subunit release factor A
MNGSKSYTDNFSDFLSAFDAEDKANVTANLNNISSAINVLKEKHQVLEKPLAKPQEFINADGLDMVQKTISSAQSLNQVFEQAKDIKFDQEDVSQYKSIINNLIHIAESTSNTTIAQKTLELAKKFNLTA